MDRAYVPVAWPGGGRMAYILWRGLCRGVGVLFGSSVVDQVVLFGLVVVLVGLALCKWCGESFLCSGLRL